MYELVERALSAAPEDPPCGPNLEYDPSFLELETAVHPATGSQFDDDGLRTSKIDWHLIERLAISLLGRSKDLRIAVLLLRAWVRLHGMAGLAAGLALTLNLLERYWDCVHPRIDAEDNGDVTMRINALAPLAHHEGLLADVRACAVAWDAFEPITARDLELALTPDASPSGKRRGRAPETILQLAREQSRQRGGDLNAASRLCLELQRLLIGKVGPRRAPDLAPLSGLIGLLQIAFPMSLGGSEDSAEPAQGAAAPAATTLDHRFDDEVQPGVRGRDELLDDVFGLGPAATSGAGGKGLGISTPLQAGAPYSSSDRRPVLLGVSAPRTVAAGESFSARFVAFAAGLEARVKQILVDLDGDRSNPVLGIAPERMAAWRAGTPVTVRLSGERIAVAPAERFFEWNGAHNLVSFNASVDPDAPAGPHQILFEAFIAAVPIVSIPLTLQVGATRAETQTATAAAPRTAFASYASADAALVAMCLSILARWDPGLSVFMDCLDLTPNKDWRDQLERVIEQVDAFMLFWSKHAMASEHVKWEWQTAREKKGIAFIRPFPLDDPAVAPPPAELQHLHFRDRYLMARQAMLRLADEIRNR